LIHLFYNKKKGKKNKLKNFICLFKENIYGKIKYFFKKMVVQTEEVLEISKKVLTNHGVKRAGLFGSFSRNEQNDKSDVDIIIEFKPGYLKDIMQFISIKEELEKSLDRSVDLLEFEIISEKFKLLIIKDLKIFIE
jgi:uncharacterized protein